MEDTDASEWEEVTAHGDPLRVQISHVLEGGSGGSRLVFRVQLFNRLNQNLSGISVR